MTSASLLLYSCTMQRFKRFKVREVTSGKSRVVGQPDSSRHDTVNTVEPVPSKNEYCKYCSNVVSNRYRITEYRDNPNLDQDESG